MFYLIYSEEVSEHQHVCLLATILLANDSSFKQLYSPSHSGKSKHKSQKKQTHLNYYLYNSHSHTHITWGKKTSLKKSLLLSFKKCECDSCCSCPHDLPLEPLPVQSAACDLLTSCFCPTRLFPRLWKKYQRLWPNGKS